MSNLQFQDFNFGDLEDSPFTNANSNTVQDYKPANKPPNSVGLGASNESSEGASTTAILRGNIFSFKFYQQYFDVDTEQVASRLLNSFIPKIGKNYISDFVQPLPDLYGPFWVVVTLIFSTAICGNLAHYIETSGLEAPIGNDFRIVTGVSSLIFSYVILVPFAIYSLLWYRKAALQYSYLEILCAYGYSLSIFIPVSVLWVVHYPWFRWSLIAVSIALSGSVLAQWVYAAFKADSNRMISFGVVFGTLFLHALLAIAFKEFYFDSSIRPLPKNESSKPTLDPKPFVIPTKPDSNETAKGDVPAANQIKPAPKSDAQVKIQDKNDGTKKDDKNKIQQPTAKETIKEAIKSNNKTNN